MTTDVDPQALLEGTTPGPWHAQRLAQVGDEPSWGVNGYLHGWRHGERGVTWGDMGGQRLYQGASGDDARLIAAAPDLAAALIEARSELATAREALRSWDREHQAYEVCRAERDAARTEAAEWKRLLGAVMDAAPGDDDGVWAAAVVAARAALSFRGATTCRKCGLMEHDGSWWHEDPEDCGWWFLGFAPAPRTRLARFRYHVLHGLLMDYRPASVLWFAARAALSPPEAPTGD